MPIFNLWGESRIELILSEEIIGKYRNSRFRNILLITSGVAITIAALAGGIGNFFGTIIKT